MLKAYAFGFFSAVLAVLMVAAISFGKPTEERALVWGGHTYTTKQQFKDYLATTGLSYETWLARHPGAAPWEPGVISIGPITVRASTKAREDWVIRLPLAALGLMLAIGAVLLLLRRLRSVRPDLATKPVAFGSAFLTVLLVAAIWVGTRPTHEPEPGLVWGGTVYTTKEEFNGYLKSKGLSYDTWLARNPNAAPWERTQRPAATKGSENSTVLLLLAATGLVAVIGCALVLLRRSGRIKPELASGSLAAFSRRTSRRSPDSVAKSAQGAAISGLALASLATESLKAIVGPYGKRVLGAARAEAQRLPDLVRDRNISISYVAFGAIAATAAGMFAVFVVALLST